MNISGYHGGGSVGRVEGGSVIVVVVVVAVSVTIWL